MADLSRDKKNKQSYKTIPENWEINKKHWIMQI